MQPRYLLLLGIVLLVMPTLQGIAVAGDEPSMRSDRDSGAPASAEHPGGVTIVREGGLAMRAFTLLEDPRAREQLELRRAALGHRRLQVKAFHATDVLGDGHVHRSAATAAGTALLQKLRAKAENQRNLQVRFHIPPRNRIHRPLPTDPLVDAGGNDSIVSRR